MTDHFLGPVMDQAHIVLHQHTKLKNSFLGEGSNFEKIHRDLVKCPVWGPNSKKTGQTKNRQKIIGHQPVSVL